MSAVEEPRINTPAERPGPGGARRMTAVDTGEHEKQIRVPRLLVMAALAGVIAAILPARRAAKLDILRSLAYE